MELTEVRDPLFRLKDEFRERAREWSFLWREVKCIESGNDANLTYAEFCNARSLYKKFYPEHTYRCPFDALKD